MAYRFSWTWVKNMASKDANALALVKLAHDLQTEPERFAGLEGICDWLDLELQPSQFRQMVRELQMKFHYLKKFRNG